MQHGRYTAAVVFTRSESKRLCCLRRGNSSAQKKDGRVYLYVYLYTWVHVGVGAGAGAGVRELAHRGAHPPPRSESRSTALMCIAQHVYARGCRRGCGCGRGCGTPCSLDGGMVKKYDGESKHSPSPGTTYSQSGSTGCSRSRSHLISHVRYAQDERRTHTRA